MLKMTDALEKFLVQLPREKWFTVMDVIRLSRPRYNLDRLVKAGKLESRAMGELRDVYMEYRVL